MIDRAVALTDATGAAERVGAALLQGRIAVEIGRRQPAAFELVPADGAGPRVPFRLDNAAGAALRACTAPAPGLAEAGGQTARAPAAPAPPAGDVAGAGCAALVAEGGFTGPSERHVQYVEPMALPEGLRPDWPIPEGETREDIYSSGNGRILMLDEDSWV